MLLQIDISVEIIHCDQGLLLQIRTKEIDTNLFLHCFVLNQDSMSSENQYFQIGYKWKRFSSVTKICYQ